MNKTFKETVTDIIKSVPRGKVATYGRIATAAGNPRGARQVAYILHSCSRKENLPWHRVVNRQGGISLKPNHGYELQKKLLEEEGVEFNENSCVDLANFLWVP